MVQGVRWAACRPDRINAKIHEGCTPRTPACRRCTALMRYSFNKSKGPTLLPSFLGAGLLMTYPAVNTRPFWGSVTMQVTPALEECRRYSCGVRCSESAATGKLLGHEYDCSVPAMCECGMCTNQGRVVPNHVMPSRSGVTYKSTHLSNMAPDSGYVTASGSCPVAGVKVRLLAYGL